MHLGEPGHRGDDHRELEIAPGHAPDFIDPLVIEPKRKVARKKIPERVQPAPTQDRVGRLVRPEAGTWGVRVATEVALLALATGLAYVFWDLAMRAGDVVLVASCSYLTPFFSTVVSCLYLRVRPGVSLWVGCALIIAGSFLSWRSIRPATRETVRTEAG